MKEEVKEYLLSHSIEEITKERNELLGDSVSEASLSYTEWVNYHDKAKATSKVSEIIYNTAVWIIINCSRVAHSEMDKKIAGIGTTHDPEAFKELKARTYDYIYNSSIDLQKIYKSAKFKENQVKFSEDRAKNYLI